MNRQEGREGPEREGESGGQGVTQEPTTCKIVSNCSNDMHKLFVGLSFDKSVSEDVATPISHFILITSFMKDFSIHPYHVTPSSLIDRVSSDGKLPAAKVGQNGNTLLKTISYSCIRDL